MNSLDLLILAMVALAAVYGLTRGAVTQLFSFGGFWVGLVIGASLAPSAARLASSPTSQAFISLLVLLVVPAMLGGVGQQLGVRALGALRRARLGPADAAVGAVIASGATLAIVWLLAVVLSTGPSKALSDAIHGSEVARALVENLPPAPQVFAQIRRLVRETGFPDVFAGLEPSPAPRVVLPNDPAVRAALEATGQSTLRIVGIGCGGMRSGSGFVVAPGLVMTNAHVIAGLDTVTAQDRRGRRHRAIPVVFDEDDDVAILRVPTSADPLNIFRGDVDRGQGGAIVGYPGGGPLTADAAAVLRKMDALGRDIYGQSLTRRSVYQLQAQVRPGNSGGPFVRTNGEVLGLIFSASTTNPNLGYALTSQEVLPAIDLARARQSGVDTGRCAA